jgi:hypothetical protein
VADRFERGERAVIGVGEPAEVLLRGLDLFVADAVHHGLEVGTTGQQPRDADSRRDCQLAAIRQAVHRDPFLSADPAPQRSRMTISLSDLARVAVQISHS